MLFCCKREFIAIDALFEYTNFFRNPICEKFVTNSVTVLECLNKCKKMSLDY